MALRLSELAGRLGMRLRGEDREFSGLQTLEEAGESDVSFLSNPRYAPFLAGTKACAVIIAEEFAHMARTALISANPYLDFARAASFFVRKPEPFTGVSELAVVHPTAEVGKGCAIHPHAHVGARSSLSPGCVLYPGVYVGEDCAIGPDCVLYPNAVILAGVTLGAACVINAGAVIGTEGFGFVRADGAMRKIPQIGTVVLADGVDIGANTCVDRSTLGATRIGKESKLDNLVQIGHNVSLGEHCLIISQVGIAGSTKVGDRVTMAGQAGIAGHLSIGDDVTVGPQAGVPKDIPQGVSGSGSPFMESGTFMRAAVLLPKLPELDKRIRRLEKKLAGMEQLLARFPDTAPTSDEETP
ncbi:MAG: UDP-3-O-(3-hydroxymyristoyl)glucosamine N-acyltransferase [Desulfovibrio sp.]|jgi:UDP-3-O-[3-hydroxymyristoyl] glucosamine N-acyltransferase|nr:UDP-3-O-(3-hydroxymyristoyl)glucosamine N-acyltransferase [Desulfovibrio sp.]